MRINRLTNVSSFVRAYVRTWGQAGERSTGWIIKCLFFYLFLSYCCALYHLSSSSLFCVVCVHNVRRLSRRTDGRANGSSSTNQSIGAADDESLQEFEEDANNRRRQRLTRYAAAVCAQLTWFITSVVLRYKFNSSPSESLFWLLAESHSAKPINALLLLVHAIVKWRTMELSCCWWWW